MTIKCHYDGKVFIPDEPVELAAGEAAEVRVGPSFGGPSGGPSGGTVSDVINAGGLGGWSHRIDIEDGQDFIDARRAERRAGRLSEAD